MLVSQHRRLAEFATILGDFKLAISIWETLRKESKGGAVSSWPLAIVVLTYK